MALLFLSHSEGTDPFWTQFLFFHTSGQHSGVTSAFSIQLPRQTNLSHNFHLSLVGAPSRATKSTTTPEVINTTEVYWLLQNVLTRPGWFMVRKEWYREQTLMTRLWSFRRCWQIQPVGGQLWRLDSSNERSNYISKLMIFGRRSDRPFRNVNRMSKKTNIILVDFINLGPNFASKEPAQFRTASTLSIWQYNKKIATRA